MPTKAQVRRAVATLMRKCLRCGKCWMQNGVETPNTCPKCKSKFWNVPKPKKAA